MRVAEEPEDTPELIDIFTRIRTLSTAGRKPFTVAGVSSYGSYARSIIVGRRRIGHYFSESLFADPVFDILLDLYASACEGKEVSMSDACVASRVPSTTAHRYVAELVRRGWVIRSEDPVDRRRVILTLSDDASARMQRYLEEISSIPLRR